MINRIGIDLDNTILKYDEVFHSLALAESWIDRDCLCDKGSIKIDLAKNAESSDKSESRWQQLQAWAYGKHIQGALVFDGFFDFVKQARQRGDELFIVSHKTEFSNYDSNVHLWSAAINTLDQRGFFMSIDKNGLGFSRQDVFFAPSLDEKIQKIQDLNLTHFIDDLPKVMRHPEFPQNAKKILFSPGQEKDPIETQKFQAWADIEEYFRLPTWLEETLSSTVSSIHLLPSSGNNRIYKIEMTNGKNYAAKHYLQLSEDSRPRLQAEFDHLSALWQLGFRNIPQPIQKKDSRAIYSLVEGASVASGSAKEKEIEKILSFLTRLSDVDFKLRVFSILPAADSRSCLGDYIDQIEKRSDRISMGAKGFAWENEIIHFMKERLSPYKDFIFNKFYDSIESFGWDLQRPFKKNEQMFSPSDLGFHNILVDTEGGGKLFFLDFEYSGWDDPAKLLADFFHHVAQQVPWEHKWYLLDQFAAHRYQDPGFLKRWETIIDLIGLEWVLIVLNVADPNEMQRKQFANPSLDPADLVKTRLIKANEMIDEMAERMRQGEERISIPPRKQMVSH